MEFRKDFCPAHSDATAINTLESTSYYQKTWGVDDYLDEFLELVVEVGYTNLRMVVVKFRKGLDPQIQNSIATMPYGRPLDTSPGDWYKAAKTIDQNQEANEAFQLASRPAPHPAPCSTPISLVKINPIPVNTDVGLKKNPPPPTCYRCHKTGHKAPDCPDKYDIRMSSVEELEMEIMVRRDVMKMEKIPESEKDFIPDNE